MVAEGEPVGGPPEPALAAAAAPMDIVAPLAAPLAVPAAAPLPQALAEARPPKPAAPAPEEEDVERQVSARGKGLHSGSDRAP